MIYNLILNKDLSKYKVSKQNVSEQDVLIGNGGKSIDFKNSTRYKRINTCSVLEDTDQRHVGKTNFLIGRHRVKQVYFT